MLILGGEGGELLLGMIWTEEVPSVGSCSILYSFSKVPLICVLGFYLFRILLVTGKISRPDIAVYASQTGGYLQVHT